MAMAENRELCDAFSGNWDRPERNLEAPRLLERTDAFMARHTVAPLPLLPDATRRSPVHKFVVLYPCGAVFCSYYESTHIPLAAGLPGQEATGTRSPWPPPARMHLPTSASSKSPSKMQK